MTPPYNRWAYLHMRTIFPSAPVPNGGPVRPLHVDLDTDISNLRVNRPAGGSADFSDFLRETFTDSFLVTTPIGWSTSTTPTACTPRSLIR